MGIASFVQAKGCPWRRGGGISVCSQISKWLQCWTGPGEWNQGRRRQRRSAEYLPAQWAGCSARVTARGRGGEGARAKIDAKHALVLHVVTFASRLPSVSLEPPARPTCCVCLDDSANRDICWEMKAWAKFECQYPRHGRRGGANKRRSVCHRAVFILQMKGYRATCVPERNDHF